MTESTLIMVDDNIDEIFLTRRKVRRDGIINRFFSEKRPERIEKTLDDLVKMGISKESFIVLLDINMPRVDGFEVLRKLRAHPEYGSVTVIMLSASQSDDDIARAREAGCDGYIVKPFSGEEFLDLIRETVVVKKKIVRIDAGEEANGLLAEPDSDESASHGVGRSGSAGWGH